MSAKKKKQKSLYWSSFNTYRSCPQRFLWAYGHPAYDLGAGLGKPKPEPPGDKKSEHDALIGTVIQYAVERLYNDKLWKDPANLMVKLENIVSDYFHEAQKSRYINWSFSPSASEMLETCMAGVRGYIKTLKHHALIGEYTKAEKFLMGFLQDFPIAARVDVLISREPKPGRLNPGVTIIDGKNSKHKDKYTDPGQLIWYALCYYLQYKKLPDRLGFAYYRYPYGTPIEDSDEVETGISWVSFDQEDVRNLARKAIEARESILAREFEATPQPSYCRWCPWESVCEPRQEQKATNSRNRGAKKKSLVSVDVVVDSDGFAEIDFENTEVK